MQQKVIAIFDIGKTNKKLVLYNESYEIIYETSRRFAEISDEDDDPCEDIVRLTSWIHSALDEILISDKYAVKAVNFSAYGASVVYIGENGQYLTPLYNYLKPYPESLSDNFYRKYGGRDEFSVQTASPALGSLNSGLQIYRISQTKPEVADQLKYVLHFPQYLSFLLSGQACSDKTSIGCHTGMWDFENQQYHYWLKEEGLEEKLAPILSGKTVVNVRKHDTDLAIGIGLHDSSAAMIPYLKTISGEYLLLSTGTWSICLNPFNNSPLTIDELKRDCLSYLNISGKPVKASRLFAGHEHEQGIQRIAAHFHIDEDFYKSVKYNADLSAQAWKEHELTQKIPEKINTFSSRDLSAFNSYAHAYHQLIADIMFQQYHSIMLVISETIESIYVDGGFSNNMVFMQMLANCFPQHKIYAASVSQASALGAALAIHDAWNENPIPSDLIRIIHFPAR